MLSFFRKPSTRSKKSTNTRRLKLEAFEPRNLLSSGPFLVDHGQKLLIEGTMAADTAQVDMVNNQIEVKFNSQTFSFDSAGVKHIIFRGYFGDDTFINNTSLTSAALGMRGKDTLIGGSSRDVLEGGDGDDYLDGRQGNDGLNGMAGHDKIFGAAGKDLLLGGTGWDKMDGGEDDDVLSGDLGNDSENGGSGNDRMIGGEGKDSEIGDSGDDRIFGNNGNDYLSGGQGDDSLYGGNGNDSLSGGLGADSMHGGSGRDSGACDSDDTSSELEDLELVAMLLGSGKSGQAEFKPGASEDKNLEVEVLGVGQNVTLTVKVDGVQVGQLVSDSEGEGEFKLKDPNLVIAAGTVLTLEDANGNILLTGTFANSQGNDGEDD